MEGRRGGGAGSRADPEGETERPFETRLDCCLAEELEERLIYPPASTACEMQTSAGMFHSKLQKVKIQPGASPSMKQ